MATVYNIHTNQNYHYHQFYTTLKKRLVALQKEDKVGQIMGMGGAVFWAKPTSLMIFASPSSIQLHTRF